LAALVRWFLAESADDIPARTHNRETDAGGVPEWHAAFRAWLTAPPDAVDKEGYVRSPLRFWLWKMRGNGGKDSRRAEFLFRLAVLGGDWQEAVHARRSMSKWKGDMAEAYALASLRIFWRLMQQEPRKFVGDPKGLAERRIGKSEAQHAAEG